MELLASQQSDSALTSLCNHGIELLATGKMAEVAASFGYAVALGRTAHAAIQADLASSLAAVGGSQLRVEGATLSISHYEPNDSGLLSVVECFVPTEPHGSILVEFVVTAKETERHLTLEQISFTEQLFHGAAI